MSEIDYELNRELFTQSRPAPTSESEFATYQSIPLLADVLGSHRYLRSLHVLSSEILSELIDLGSPATKVMKSRRADHEYHLAVILHSAAHVASNWPNMRNFAVPRDGNVYSRPRYGHLQRHSMRRLSSLLTGKDGKHFDSERVPGALFDCRMGFHHRNDPKKGVVTRLIPNRRILDRMTKAGLVFTGHPHENRESFDPTRHVVTIDKRPIERDLRPEEQVIPWLNEKLAATTVTLALPDFPAFTSGYDFDMGHHRLSLWSTQLTRMFKGDDHSGGRLFGHAVQNMPSSLRRHLLIDGEPTCEWDYQSMQPNLAYSIVGAVCPEGDAYKVPGYLYWENRPKFKALFPTAIGCDADTNPVAAFAAKVHRDTGSWMEPGKASQMDRDFWRYHHQIQRFRASEGWRQLQYLESEICLKVLKYLKDWDVVCIPIFDSFIVQKRHEELLKEAMRWAVADLSSPPGIKPN